MFTQKGLSRHPHLSLSHMPSVTLARLARTHCMYAACTVWALPLRYLCVALTLLVRCLCPAFTLPVRFLCAAMRAACALQCMALCAAMHGSVRCHTRLCALPCAPLFPTVGNMHVFEPVSRVPTASVCRPYPQGLGGVHPWRGHGPPFSLRTCSTLKEHYKPFPEFFEETSEVAEEV